MEAVDVDAVGDDGGALGERAEGGEFVEDRLGGNDERVGVFVQFALKGPVPFRVGLESVDGVDEFRCVHAFALEAAVGEGGEEVGVDEHGVEGVGFLFVEELGELAEGRGRWSGLVMFREWTGMLAAASCSGIVGLFIVDCSLFIWGGAV